MTTIQKYLESTYGIDANTSATIFITIFIFLTGIFFQQILVFYNSFNQRRRIRKIFKLSLESFISQVRKQAGEYEKISNTLTFEKESHFEFNRATISSLSSLISLGYHKTYESCFLGLENVFQCNLKLKMKAFNKVWDSITSVEFWHEKSFEYSSFIDDYNQINERRNLAVENHRRFFEPIMISLNGKTLEKRLGEYFQMSDNIHSEWQRLPNRTRPDVIHRRLITRMRILNKKYQDIDIANEMNKNLLSASLEYQNQRALLSGQKKQFNNYHKAFRKYWKTCKVANKII